MINNYKQKIEDIKNNKFHLTNDNVHDIIKNYYLNKKIKNKDTYSFCILFKKKYTYIISKFNEDVLNIFDFKKQINRHQYLNILCNINFSKENLKIYDSFIKSSFFNIFSNIKDFNELKIYLLNEIKDEKIKLHYRKYIINKMFEFIKIENFNDLEIAIILNIFSENFIYLINDNNINVQLQNIIQRKINNSGYKTSKVKLDFTKKDILIKKTYQDSLLTFYYEINKIINEYINPKELNISDLVINIDPISGRVVKSSIFNKIKLNFYLIYIFINIQELNKNFDIYNDILKTLINNFKHYNIAILDFDLNSNLDNILESIKTKNIYNILINIIIFIEMYLRKILIYLKKHKIKFNEERQDYNNMMLNDLINSSKGLIFTDTEYEVFKVLLCSYDDKGYDLRNKILHGLISKNDVDNECIYESFCLIIYFLSFITKIEYDFINQVK